MALGELITQLEQALAIGARSDAASDTAATASIVALLRMLQKANRGSFGEIVRKTVTFDGGSGSGAVGTVAVLTVTGAVRLKITAVCSTLLAGATATIELGVSGNTAVFIAQTTGTDVDANEIWHDATPDASIELDSVAPVFIVTNGQDVIITVGTANVDSGVLAFTAEWEPVSADGNVVAA